MAELAAAWAQEYALQSDGANEGGRVGDDGGGMVSKTDGTREGNEVGAIVGLRVGNSEIVGSCVGCCDTVGCGDGTISSILPVITSSNFWLSYPAKPLSVAITTSILSQP